MAVPVTNQSWQIWENNGNPLGTFKYVIDTYTATYCDGATLRTVDFELSITNVTQDNTNIDGVNYTTYEHVMTVSASTAIIGSADVSLFIRKATRAAEIPPNETDPVTPWTEIGTAEEIIFNSGSSLTQDTSRFVIEIEADQLVNPDTFQQETYWGLPETAFACSAPCDLRITGTTVTPETTSGAGDGSIEIFISGSTGTTTYYLNGLNPQASNTFTGLTSGTYSVEIEEGSCFDQETGLVVAAGEFRSSPFQVIEPNNFLASENPIVTTLRTATNGAPAFAQTDFVFSSSVVDGSEVTFNLINPNAYNVTFTAKDFPNRANYFVTPTLKNRAGINVGVNTAAEIATTFAEAVSKDVVLSRYYFVDTSGSTVTLTAKQATARMTLDTTNITVGAGITLNTITNGADQYEGSIISDYSLYTDVYVGAEGSQYGDTLSSIDYDNYTSLELPYSRDNIHKFDVSDVMKNFVFTPKIDLTFTGFTYITDMIRPFYIKYGENYPLVVNENTKKKRRKGDTGYKWVLNSSLDFEDANDVSAYFTGGSFLTNSPNPLQVQRNQTSFLYFIIEKDLNQDLTVKGDIEFYDGTSSTNQTFITISTGATNNGGVYALNVSYSALGLATYENAGNTKIKRVTFGVYADGVLFSEEKTFRFEIDEQPRKFGVSFLNKLGAYDTFDFVGVVENGIQRTNKTYTTPRVINSNGSSPVGFKSKAMYDTQVTKTITVNSGWIDSAHFDWLIELFESNNIYSYTEDNQNYLNVTGYTYSKSSLDDLFELEVTFELTLFENNISL